MNLDLACHYICHYIPLKANKKGVSKNTNSLILS